MPAMPANREGGAGGGDGLSVNRPVSTAEHQAELDALYAALVDQTRRKVCLVSGKPPIIPWTGKTYVATCVDHNPRSCLWKRQDVANERYWAMTSHSLANRPQTAALTVAEVKTLICPLATDTEATAFLRFCVANDLNPFIYDCYLVKYTPGEKPAIVIGIQALLKRAARSQSFRGYQSGIIVQRGSEVVELAGSFHLPTDQLMGGWAIVYRAGAMVHQKGTLSFREYDQGRALWKSKPGTMIEKTALAQQLRRVYPEVDALFNEAAAAVEGGVVEVLDPDDIKTGSAEASQVTPGHMEMEQEKADLYGPSPKPPPQPPARVSTGPAQRTEAPTPPPSIAKLREAVEAGFTGLGLSAQAARRTWRQVHCPMLPEDARSWTAVHYQELVDALLKALVQPEEAQP